MKRSPSEGAYLNSARIGASGLNSSHEYGKTANYYSSGSNPRGVSAHYGSSTRNGTQIFSTNTYTPKPLNIESNTSTFAPKTLSYSTKNFFEGANGTTSSGLKITSNAISASHLPDAGNLSSRTKRLSYETERINVGEPRFVGYNELAPIEKVSYLEPRVNTHTQESLSAAQGANLRQMLVDSYKRIVLLGLENDRLTNRITHLESDGAFSVKVQNEQGSLKSQILNLENRVSELMSERSKFLNEIESLRMANNRAASGSSEIVDLKNKISMLASENERLLSYKNEAQNLKIEISRSRNESSQLSALRSEIQALQNDLSKANTRVTVLTNENAHLKQSESTRLQSSSELSELRSQIASLHQLQQENNNLKSRLSAINVEIEQYRSETNILKNRLQTVTSENSRLQASGSSEVSSLRNQLSQTQASLRDITEYKNRITVLSTELELAQKNNSAEMADLRNKISMLSVENERLQTFSREQQDLKGKIALLASENERLLHSNSHVNVELESENRNLRNQLDSLRNNANLLKKSVTSQNNDVMNIVEQTKHDYEKRIMNLESDLARIRNESNMLKKSNGGLVRVEEIENLTQMINNATIEKEELCKTLFKLTNDNSELRATVQSRDNELANERKQSNAFRLRIEELTKTNTNLTNSLRLAERDLEELKILYENTESRLTMEIDILKQSVENYEKEISDLKLKMAHLEETLTERFKTDIANLQSHMYTIETENSQLKGEIKDLDEILHANEKLIADLRMRIKELERLNAALKEENAALSEKLLLLSNQPTKTAVEKVVETVVETKVDNREIDRLNGLLMEKQREISDLQAQLRALQLKLNSTSDDLSGMSSWKLKYEQLYREHENLQSRFRDLEGSKRRLEEEIRSLQQQLQAEKQRSSALESKVSQLQSEISNLSRQVETLRRENESKNSRISQLEQELKQLRIEFDRANNELRLSKGNF